ncbi:unnamed protein product [Didymodactylos carnosus]|uniref:Calnexin n=1 Tax=Didymodactylos carnosus TaxID=1234261 RepID=A0A813NW83_9BILA|nr:unnamed protein product [Didymodactylos carnosus]CAF0827086.1 unnamed protein product [Didymodactylos carnosus]CAF3522275.1 unnamed protein product [Didymodactylos carnosus]CAF3611588.1 unnamed protein product [Didymodactylos carnosus]
MRLLTGCLVFFLLCIPFISCYDDDDDNDNGAEEIIPEASTATSAPLIEKGNVPVIKSASNSIYFEDQFQEKSKWSRWVKSQAKKDGVDDTLAKYDGEWGFEIPVTAVYTDDYSLILKSKAKHHAIAAPLFKPFDFQTSPLVVQYEVKYQTNQECGGAYVKLLSDSGKIDLKQVTDKTPYTIMFGPDMCGVEMKYHFIIRYRNPKTGVYSEHQAKKPSESLDTYFTDKKSHLYTLVLSADNSFKMYIDNKLINSGNLLEDMEPAITPAKEIIDENDSKPSDWDDRERIPDSTAFKPEDWDETEPKQIVDEGATIPSGWLENESTTIPDPDAVKPDDWDDDVDGDWEPPRLDNPLCKNAVGCGPWTAPLIPNPKYKGTWRAPLIDNPNYKGKWEARKIPNPDYFEDAHPYKLTPFSAVALELWSIIDGVVFDNFLITSDQSLAKQYGDTLWYPKSSLEGKTSSSSESVVEALMNATKDRPWLWALYLVVIVLPIIILIAFFWSRKSKKSPISDMNARKKKTDDATLDDVEQESSERTTSELRTSKTSQRNVEDQEDDNDSDDKETQGQTSATRAKKNVEQRSTTQQQRTGKGSLEKDTADDDEEENDGNEQKKSDAEYSGEETKQSSAPSSPSATKARLRVRKD